MNQDPVKDCFYEMRPHGVTNTKPIDLQVTAALKIVLIVLLKKWRIVTRIPNEHHLAGFISSLNDVIAK